MATGPAELDGAESDAVPQTDDEEGTGTDDPTTAGADTTGVRARLSILEPPNCTVAETLAEGATATDVRRATSGDRAVEQFRSERPLDADPVFETGDEYVYRVADEDDRGCPCRLIESLGYPLENVTVETNPARLDVSLLLPSAEPIVDIVAELEATGASVRLECLVRSLPDEAEPIVVDAGRLTDRQREVLEVAYREGYFAYPREGDAATVAEELGIVRSTFAEHLAAAQRRLFAGIFEEHGAP